jgi:uncharacterized membrane protein YgdD (TMEM256/DUF423 family)
MKDGVMKATWIFNALGAVFGLLAVIAGAMAAHAISDPHAAAMVEKAALYALLHAGLLVVWSGTGVLALVIRLTMTGGIVLFSGSIIGKYVFDLYALSALAPTGGVLLMVGWALLILYAILNRRT